MKWALRNSSAVVEVELGEDEGEGLFDLAESFARGVCASVPCGAHFGPSAVNVGGVQCPHDRSFHAAAAEGDGVDLPRFARPAGSRRLAISLRSVRALQGRSIDAEAASFAILSAVAEMIGRNGKDWFDRFSIYARVGKLVLRTQLVSRENYVAHLADIRDWEGHALEQEMNENLRARLPARFWLVEASAPELFGTNRRKFGELLLDAENPLPKPLSFAPLVAARLPGLILTPNHGTLDTAETALQGHTPWFTMPCAPAH